MTVDEERRAAKAAGAWEPTATELARLILAADSDPELRVSHECFGRWSFYRGDNLNVHASLCGRTGLAYVTELEPKRVYWATKEQVLWALWLSSTALER